MHLNYCQVSPTGLLGAIQRGFFESNRSRRRNVTWLRVVARYVLGDVAQSVRALPS
jgi:hypothetical protein